MMDRSGRLAVSPTTGMDANLSSPNYDWANPYAHFRLQGGPKDGIISILIISRAMEPTFGYLVSNIARLMRRNFDRRAHRLGVSLAQGRAMVYIARHEGINQVRLANLLEVQPISLARLLDRMEAAGWVERRSDPDDRRAHRLYLSEKAHPLLDQLEEMSAETRGDALAELSKSETDVLMRLLAQVHDNLSNRESVGDEAAESIDDRRGMADDRVR